MKGMGKREKGDEGKGTVKLLLSLLVNYSDHLINRLTGNLYKSLWIEKMQQPIFMKYTIHRTTRQDKGNHYHSNTIKKIVISIKQMLWKEMVPAATHSLWFQQIKSTYLFCRKIVHTCNYF